MRQNKEWGVKLYANNPRTYEWKEWLTCLWHSKNNTFYYDNNIFINNKREKEILNVRSKFENEIARNNDIQNINFIDKFGKIFQK